MTDGAERRPLADLDQLTNAVCPAAALGAEVLTDAGAAAVLANAKASGLLELGLVNIISVEAIRERLGERWVRRRDDIWNYAERCLERWLCPGDIVRRVNEIEYLVVANRNEVATAQGLCLKALEETLTFFLGRADAADMTVRTVTDLQGDLLLCEKVDPSAPPPALIAAKTAAPASPQNPFSELSPMSFVALSGRDIRVDFEISPLISIQYSALAAMRMHWVARYDGASKAMSDDEVAQLATAEILRIDQQAMDCLEKMLAAKRRKEQAVILPMSFRSAGTGKARLGLAALAATPEYAFKSRGLVELYDIDAGTPLSRVTEVVGLLRVFCRAVILRLPQSAKHLGGCGQHGVAVRAPPLADDPGTAAMRLLEAGEGFKGVAPMRAAFDLPLPSFVGIAQMAGFTHATIVQRQKSE